MVAPRQSRINKLGRPTHPQKLNFSYKRITFIRPVEGDIVTTGAPKHLRQPKGGYIILIISTGPSDVACALGGTTRLLELAEMPQ